FEIGGKFQFARQGQGLVEGRHNLAGESRVEPAAGVALADRRERLCRDPAAAGGGAIEPRIVAQHQGAVAGQPHVELDPGAAQRLGPAQPRQGILRRASGSTAMADDGVKRRTGRPPAAARFECRRQSAACSCGTGSCWRRAEPRSSPVCWSTWRMLSLTLPRSSKPSTLTLTLSPTLTTLATLPTRCGARPVIWTSPSREPRKFTKAPKSTTLTTLPV